MKQFVILSCCLLAISTATFAQEKKQLPPPPPPPPQKVDLVKINPPLSVKEGELADFYQRNPAVEKIAWKSSHTVIISFKDKGKKAETYDLTDENEEKTFREKYGEAPQLVPPPPPPPGKKARQLS